MNDPASTESSTYFKEWYRDNGDELNKSRRDRYHADPAYKERILQQNREARARRREEALKEKKKRKSVQKTRCSSAWRSVNVELTDDNGNKVVQKMFTIGTLSSAGSDPAIAEKSWSLSSWSRLKTSSPASWTRLRVVFIVCNSRWLSQGLVMNL